MEADADTEKDGSTRSLLFWWVALGNLVTGLSLFSLIVVYRKIGLTGVGALIQSKYAAGRDLVFDQVQQAFSFVQLSPLQRDQILAALIFGAICMRTSFLAQRRIDASVGDIVVGIVAPFALPFLILGSVFFWQSSSPISDDLRLFFVAHSAAFLLILLANRRVRGVLWIFLINAAACMAVALSLLALGGAF